MDRNTITGLFLIGLVLTIFSVYNQPSQADIDAENNKVELAEKKKVAQDAQTKKEKVIPANQAVKKETEVAVQPVKEFLNVVKEEKLYTIENDQLRIELTDRGGQVNAVYLKNYRSYEDYVSKKKDALCLFKGGDATNQLVFEFGDKTIYTSKYKCSVIKNDAKSITFELKLDEKKAVHFVYDLSKKGFSVNHEIDLVGFSNSESKNIKLNWKTSFRKTERLASEQTRVSTICYEYKKEGYSYLSETSSDSENPEDDINWVAYKQSYFSSILHPEKGFSKNNGEIKVDTYNSEDKRTNTHLKDFSSNLSLIFNQNKQAKFTWFFGPNDYETLAATNKNYPDILNFGWGLFRWINLYAVQPIFNTIISFGSGIGWAILILTIVLKLILMPIQWKMFVSSVKMKLLKPEIDTLNAKFPNKEDAMKKQVEMMALYKDSGASPLAGCLPMLIQMPILLAVFRFFPAAFELRQQPFLWAEDLSSYDSVWDFGFNIWLYGDHVSLFTLLMSITTLLYTYMNSGNVQQPSTPGMPNMKVIMYIFPIMMIFFFNNYSSGLSYYYFISTLVSILMMVAIKKFFVNEDKLKEKMALRKANAVANPKEKKKSRFQLKLEEMQKQQQEIIKNKKR